MSKDLTLTAFLSILIFFSGSLKVPSPIPGSEFQLSAPIAVLTCAYFGFKRYFTAGIIASLLGLFFGTATVFNIVIALVFRLVVGAVISLGGTSLPVIAVSGPLGTLAARIVISLMLQVDCQLLIYAALPGMIFTAIVSVLLFKPVKVFLTKIPIVQKYLLQ